MTIIFAYIFYFVAASISPLQRRWLAKNRNHSNYGQITFAFQVTLIVWVLALLLLLYQPFNITGNILLVVILALSCGFFGMVSTIFSYKAQKHVEAGVGSLIQNLNTPVAIILASTFLAEKLTLIQIIGTTILFTGILIVSKKHRVKRFRFDRYFLMMVGAGLSLGIGLFCERYLQNTTGFVTGTLLSWTSILLFLGFATLFEKKKHTYTKREIFTTGILRFFQSLSWVVLVYVIGNLSYVSSITTFKVVIMFFGGALFLHEKDDLKRKIIGSIVAVIGLFLMK